MNNTRNQLSQLLSLGFIPADKINQALNISNINPNHNAWKSFIANLLLWLGVLAIASSVLFFIAYNWDELGRFAKFGLVEVLIAVSIFVYWKSKNKVAYPNYSYNRSNNVVSNNLSAKLISKAALSMASILLGVLLAFYGQTYQTGADTWQLFFTWAILIIPWVVISRFPALWIFWLALINLTTVLYFQIFNSFWGAIFSSQTSMLWALIAINSVAFIIWELLEKRYSWLDENWASRLLAFGAGAPLTFLVIESIFNRYNGSFLPVIIWLLGLTLIYWVYRKVKLDVFMISMACLSGIIVIISAVSKVLFKSVGDSFGVFLMLSILVIILGTLSALWLKKLHRESEQL